MIIICLLILSLSTGINCTSCDQGICTCNNHIALCINVLTPTFKYRPEITSLYLQKVQILGFENILRMLPNLKYLTLRDMLYFNCEWMNDLSTSIVISSDSCLSKTTQRTGGKFVFFKLI